MNIFKYARLGIRKAQISFSVGLLLPVLIILSIAGPAEAERVSLRQAINSALNDSHDLKAYSWMIEDQQSDVNSSRGHFYPRLTIEERYLRTDNPTYGFMAKLNQERFSQQDFPPESEEVRPKERGDRT